MHINMNDSRLVSIAQLREFLKVNAAINFVATNRKEKYQWINKTLTKFGYLRLAKQQDKTLVLNYVLKMTGLSKVQLKRLVEKKRQTGVISVAENWGKKNTFPVKYGPSDIA